MGIPLEVQLRYLNTYSKQAVNIFGDIESPCLTLFSNLILITSNSYEIDSLDYVVNVNFRETFLRDRNEFSVAVPVRLENLMKSNLYHYGKHELLIGVTRAEYYIHFGAEDVQLGIDEKKRYDIVHKYILDTLQVNTAAITAVAVNEYTDWTTPDQDPIDLLNAAADLLGDAHRVAPVVQAARHHAEAKQKTFMYVFGYQTRSGDYSDRLGCIHGEDLPYVFGAPLINGTLSHFKSNYSKSERSLSDLIIHYWSNFAYTG
ncbi:Neuroligin-1 [Nymphon striatum]|nr:Neuroligin-1 [Nymphon striatum]